MLKALVLLVLALVFGIALIVGLEGARQRAVRNAEREQCAENLRRLGEGAIVYRARYGAFPKATGAGFWRALYLDPIPVAKNPRLYTCPATEDHLLDDHGKPRWRRVDDPARLWEKARPPIAADACSYAGPREVPAKDINWAGGALGADDNEPSWMPNHPDGMNLLRPDGRVQWLENVSWPAPGTSTRTATQRAFGLTLLED